MDHHQTSLGGYEPGGYEPGSYEPGGYEPGGHKSGGYEPGRRVHHQARLRRKSIFFAVLAIVSNVCGNVLLSAGMHQIGPTVSVSPLAYLRVIGNPLAVGGIVLLVIWFLANLSLLSWADLSFVLPITGTGYALAAILGWAALGESVSPGRWVGIALITGGAVLVGRTQPRTTFQPK